VGENVFAISIREGNIQEISVEAAFSERLAIDFRATEVQLLVRRD
jgi:hypothetical protein